MLNASAHDPFIRKISFLEGLPTLTVYDLFHDSKGFIYLGTDKGLVRFNGSKFTRIIFQGNLSNSVDNIREDASGTIWCKNFANQIFYLENDTLKTVDKLQQKISNDGNLKEFDVFDRLMYVATQFSVFIYSITDKQIREVLTFEKANVNNQFFDIRYDAASQSLYFTEDNKVYRYKNNKINILDSTIGQKNIALHRNDVFINLKTTDHKIINITKQKSIQSSNLIDDKTYIYYMRSVGDELWVCTNKGLYRIDPEMNSVEQSVLSQNRVSDIIMDHENNIWVSTLDDGLFFIPNMNVIQLNHVSTAINTRINYTRIAEGPDNTFFAGTNLGDIIQFDANGKVVNQFTSEVSGEVEFLYFDSTAEKIYSSVGLVNLKTGSYENHIKYGKSMYPDDKGNLVLCNYSLAGLISPKAYTMPQFPVTEKTIIERFASIYEMIIFENVRSRVVFYSEFNKQYYVGSSKGLKVINLHNEPFYITLPDGSSIIANDIKEDKYGNIWVSSMQNGLMMIRNNKVIKTYTSSSGLSSDYCRKFTFVDNTIWLITDEGLDLINTGNDYVIPISNALALKGINLNDIVYSDGNVWLATSEGILSIPQHIDFSYASPRIYINAVYAGGNKIVNNSTLAYFENDLDISFDLIHYKSQGNVKYKYRLLGYDSLWHEEPALKQHISYISLSPGNYKFQLQAIAGESASEVLEFTFIIRKPFWLTGWFYLFSAALFVYLLFIVYQFAVKRTKKKELIKQKLILSQLTALRAQMNPHFMFNVLNAVQGLIYANKKSAASDYLSKYSDLMRRTLEMSDKQLVFLASEISALEIYIELEAARFDYEFNYKLEIDPDVNTDEIKIPSMILQPYVENAIKHGLMHKRGEKLLTIHVKIKNENMLEIVIDDNGIGRAASAEINAKHQKHESFATKAIDSRINLLNNILKESISISITDKVNIYQIAEGTTVKIQIPINYA